MQQTFSPYHPNEELRKAPGQTFGESKYSYALQSIIFYSVHVGDDTLTYYKEDPATPAPTAPGILRHLFGEFEAFDFHQRYWHMREWVAEHIRKNPGCNVSFSEQTYKDLIDDIEFANNEAEKIIIDINSNE